MRSAPTLSPGLYADAADFILACLDPNPAGRPPAHSLLRLPFLAKPPSRKEAAEAAAAMEDTLGLHLRASKVPPTAGGGTASTMSTAVGLDSGSDWQVPRSVVSQASQNASEGRSASGPSGSSHSAASAGSAAADPPSLTAPAQAAEGGPSDSPEVGQPSLAAVEGAASPAAAAGASSPTKGSAQAGGGFAGAAGLVRREWLRLEGGFADDRLMEAAFVAQWPGAGQLGATRHFGTALLTLVSAAAWRPLMPLAGCGNDDVPCAWADESDHGDQGAAWAAWEAGAAHLVLSSATPAFASVRRCSALDGSCILRGGDRNWKRVRRHGNLSICVHCLAPGIRPGTDLKCLNPLTQCKFHSPLESEASS